MIASGKAEAMQAYRSVCRGADNEASEASALI